MSIPGFSQASPRIMLKTSHLGLHCSHTRVCLCVCILCECIVCLYLSKQMNTQVSTCIYICVHVCVYTYTYVCVKHVSFQKQGALIQTSNGWALRIIV